MFDEVPCPEQLPTKIIVDQQTNMMLLGGLPTSTTVRSAFASRRVVCLPGVAPLQADRTQNSRGHRQAFQLRNAASDTHHDKGSQQHGEGEHKDNGNEHGHGHGHGHAHGGLEAAEHQVAHR